MLAFVRACLCPAKYSIWGRTPPCEAWDENDRWTMDISLGEHKTSEELCQLAGVEGIENKLSDARLCWYGRPHAEKRKDHYLSKAAKLRVPVKK